MSNRYRDSMDRLHFTQEQKQEMVDRLMEAGPVSSVRRPLPVSYTHLPSPRD